MNPQTLTRHLAAQSVHLTIHPPPRSLSESKLVLSALQKYGEVVTFRNLKYDKTNTSPTAPKNTIAVFESPAAARSAIASSPLKVAVPSSSSSITSSLSSSSSATSLSTSLSTSISTHPSTQNLTCTLQPSRHNHLSSLHRNPCYGSFVPEKESYQAVDLRRTGIPVRELADVPVRWKHVSGQGRTRSNTTTNTMVEGVEGTGKDGVGLGGRGRRCRMGGGLWEMYRDGVKNVDGEGEGREVD